MNWDQIEGKWKQYAGKAKTKWGKLTDNDMQTLSGKKDQLVGLVQERYGIAKDEAERQVNDWGNSFADDNAAQRDENARRQSCTISPPLRFARLSPQPHPIPTPPSRRACVDTARKVSS